MVVELTLPHQIQVKIKVNKGKVLTLIKVMDTATTTILINKEGLELTTNRILNMVIQTIMEVELVHLLTVSSPTKRNPTNTSLSKGEEVIMVVAHQIYPLLLNLVTLVEMLEEV